MKINIESYCDGWEIQIDGKKFSWNDGDDHSILEEIFYEVCPDAEIEYEECY